MLHLPRGYVAYRTTSPITIDGRLDDPAWQDALWAEAHRDIEGDLKPDPQLRTREKMLWDDEFLYIGAELEEPHVWATLTEHDSVIFQDNDFEVFIDPDGDNHEYYEIEVNALGTWWDLLLTKPYRDGGAAVNGWEIPGARIATHVQGTLNDPSDIDRGWTVEMALPWKALSECARRPCPPRHGDQWRINFSRVQWDVTIEGGRYVKVPGRPEHNWIWSPQGVVDMHRPETWGFLQFSTLPPGTDSFRPDPSWPARVALHRVYEAQKAHRKAHGNYAAALQDLGTWSSDSPTGIAEIVGQVLAPPEIHCTPSLFEAIQGVGYPDGTTHTWHISQDSRVWENETS